MTPPRPMFASTACEGHRGLVDFCSIFPQRVVRICSKDRSTAAFAGPGEVTPVPPASAAHGSELKAAIRSATLSAVALAIAAPRPATSPRHLRGNLVASALAAETASTANSALVFTAGSTKVAADGLLRVPRVAPDEACDSVGSAHGVAGCGGTGTTGPDIVDGVGACASLLRSMVSSMTFDLSTNLMRSMQGKRCPFTATIRSPGRIACARLFSPQAFTRPSLTAMMVRVDVSSTGLTSNPSGSPEDLSTRTQNKIFCLVSAMPRRIQLPTPAPAPMTDCRALSSDTAPNGIGRHSRCGSISKYGSAATGQAAAAAAAALATAPRPLGIPGSRTV